MSPSTRSKLRRTRRRWPLAAAMAATALLAAAWGSAAGSGKSGGSGSAAGTSITAWIVTTGPSPINTKINQAVSDFEASHHGDHITIDYIENQSYKQKIQLAMGAGNPPTIFWTWGGGPLKQYIDAGDVQSLGQPSYAPDFLPCRAGAGAARPPGWPPRTVAWPSPTSSGWPGPWSCSGSSSWCRC